MTSQCLDLAHPVLGFSHTWAAKLAERVERLDAVALQVGTVDLPPNAHVHSLGKERGTTRAQQFALLQRVVAPRVLSGRLDGIFVHQTEINALLTAPWALLRRVPIVLFKAHSRSLRPALRLANRLIDVAITSTRDAYPIATRKKVVVGQGIDIDRFVPMPPAKGDPRVIAVGRYSPIKRYEVVIEAARQLTERGGPRVRFSLHGPEDDPGYRARLAADVAARNLTGIVQLEGPVAFPEVPNLYAGCDLVVHPCDTESLDKTVLEAMACGRPALTSITSYRAVLGAHADALIFAKDNPADLARKITALLTLPVEARVALGLRLRDIVKRDHSVGHLMDQVVDLFRALQNGWRP
jgi:glycosyltransferase involved in cell wall biosynthesis